MFPRNYASKVPPAGIKTHGGDSVKDCLNCDDEYHGPDTQTLFRHRWLGDPGQRLHTPGIYNPDPPSNIAFGIDLGPSNIKIFNPSDDTILVE